MEIGKSVRRVDAPDKVSGKARYTEDLIPKGCLVAKVKHSTIAHGYVTSMDTTEAEKVPGVVKIVTCFDVPKHGFPTAGHPWSVEKAHQDIADRNLLNQHVRIYNDDIAAVIAEDVVAAEKAIKLIKVEYKELPFYLTPQAAMAEDALPIHPERQDHNIIGQLCLATDMTGTGYDTIEEVFEDDKWHQYKGHFQTQQVQHCHIENPDCFAYMEHDRVTVVSSTQLPHITRRVVGQALGIPWGSVRIIKPYIGGGFGNKQDVLYEPLCAYLTTQVGGRPVRLITTREETFQNTRSRHAITLDVQAAYDDEGRLQARKLIAVANNGGYASHGNAICANCVTGFRQLYPDNIANATEAYTVYTNRSTQGAMRAYGIPQCCWVAEGMMDDIALELGMDPIDIRLKNIARQGYQDPFNGIMCHTTALAECIKKGAEWIEWDKKREEYKNQTGNLRHGIGMAVFSYKAGVYPIALESESARMILNQDGTAQLQVGAVEIGQGADTVFSQMAADAVGMNTEDIHIVSFQDTDVVPYGSGAYASRQTYTTGGAIRKVGLLFRERILAYAHEMLPNNANLDIINGAIWDTHTNKEVLSMADLAETAFYSLQHSVHIMAETTHQTKTNTLCFGCTFVDIDVDMAIGTVKVNRICNVHDAGKIINPQLAEAQVHGGMSMCLGYALSEEMVFDEKTGRLLNDNLLDYKLPTSMDSPEFKCMFIETDDPTGPFGNKSLGEPPTITAAPAIRNAILNATGVKFYELPLSPQRLVERFLEEGLI